MRNQIKVGKNKTGLYLLVWKKWAKKYFYVISFLVQSVDIMGGNPGL